MERQDPKATVSQVQGSVGLCPTDYIIPPRLYEMGPDAPVMIVRVRNQNGDRLAHFQVLSNRAQVLLAWAVLGVIPTTTTHNHTDWKHCGYAFVVG